MIPTQPGLPIPNLPPNPYDKRWQCPYCQQLIGEMQYHNCQGTTVPSQPLRVWQSDNTFEPVAEGWPGLLTDVTMYSDYKKLFKRDTLAKLRINFQQALDDIELNTPEESVPVTFDIDGIMDVFDDVAKDFHDDSSL